jgi:hypothetical protein
MLLTPFTKVTTGVDIARRARKYANKGQYDRAIRYYNRRACPLFHFNIFFILRIILYLFGITCAVMKVMPEKQPSIRKKIAKLEERKRAQAATPVGASALKGTHRTRTHATAHSHTCTPLTLHCVIILILSYLHREESPTLHAIPAVELVVAHAVVEAVRERQEQGQDRQDTPDRTQEAVL